MTKEPLIYSAISEVMKKIWAVKKDKNAWGGSITYKFRWIDDMYNAVHPILSECGVFFTSEIISQSVEQRDKVVRCVIIVKWTVYASDGSHITTQTLWEWNDYSDKACNKAMSGAYKYALMQLFCIPTEEPKDSENDNIATPAKKSFSEQYVEGWCKDKKLRSLLQDWFEQMPEERRQYLIKNDPQNFFNS